MNADPRAIFINIAVACCHAHDWTALALGFSGLPGPLASDLAREVSERLFASGQRTGDLATWAEALHHLPRRGWAEAGRTFADRLAAWIVPQAAKPVDDGARRLRALACRLIRGGTAGRELLRRLDEADATLARPVSAEEIGRIATWAARAARRDKPDARR